MQTFWLIGKHTLGQMTENTVVQVENESSSEV